jgi:hypothetical protein
VLNSKLTISRKACYHTLTRMGASSLFSIWKRRIRRLRLHMCDFTTVSAHENSNSRSATLITYSRASSGLRADCICKRRPDDVVLPGRTLGNPEADSTPEAVCEATPVVFDSPCSNRYKIAVRIRPTVTPNSSIYGGVQS